MALSVFTPRSVRRLALEEPSLLEQFRAEQRPKLRVVRRTGTARSKAAR